MSTEDTDAETWTPLCCCADPYFTGLLIEHGANVNYADRDNWTPLHQAVHNGDYDSAQRLLDAGADINIRTTDDGLTVMERVRDMGNRELGERFVELLERSMVERKLEQAITKRTSGKEEDCEKKCDDVEEVGGKFEIV